MKEIYIVGEDDVTKAVIRRLIQDYAPARLPASHPIVFILL